MCVALAMCAPSCCTQLGSPPPPPTDPGAIATTLNTSLNTYIATRNLTTTTTTILHNTLNSDIEQEYAASLGNLSACWWDDGEEPEDDQDGWVGSTGYGKVLEGLVVRGGVGDRIVLNTVCCFGGGVLVWCGVYVYVCVVGFACIIYHFLSIHNTNVLCSFSCTHTPHTIPPPPSLPHRLSPALTTHPPPLLHTTAIYWSTQPQLMVNRRYTRRIMCW